MKDRTGKKHCTIGGFGLSLCGAAALLVSISCGPPEEEVAETATSQEELNVYCLFNPNTTACNSQREGQACDLTLKCESGLRCHWGICRSNECSTDRDCSSEGQPQWCHRDGLTGLRTCRDPQANGWSCEEARQEYQCTTGICNKRGACADCRYDSQCDNEGRCSDLLCECVGGKKSVGESCSRDSDCITDACDTGWFRSYKCIEP